MSRDDIKECLRERIEKAKQWNVSDFGEIQAKRAIMEPILDCLEWDTSNPGEVRLEYPTPSGDRVDYALLKGGDPVALLEAKKPGESLDNPHYVEQILKYAFQKGVPLAILSNGVEWSFYLPLEKGDWETRKFYSIDLNAQGIDSVCDTFVEFLSKDNVMSGAALESAKDKLDRQKREIRIRQTLPEAWKGIITEPNESLVQLLIEETERRCGFKPDESQVKTFLKKPVKETLPVAQPKIHNRQRVSGERFVLPVDLRLHKKYGGRKFRAVTVTNNEIRLEIDGEPHTLNEGALLCMRTISPHVRSVDAWTWWKCIHPKTGKEVLIDVLRKE